jgi:hypothetical protein
MPAVALGKTTPPAPSIDDGSAQRLGLVPVDENAAEPAGVECFRAAVVGFDVAE